MLDRFDCYELCVQSPRHVVSFLRGVHGGDPVVLWEDFCGGAAVSRRWAAEGVRAGDSRRAVAVDLDEETLAKARRAAATENVADRVRFVHADATQPHAAPDEPRAADPSDSADAADVVFVGNFSIGYIHDRATLVRYLARVRDRLSRGGAGWGGVLACDTYGGSLAFRLGGFTRKHPGRSGETIHYSWMHEQADPRTAMVENSISFRVEVAGEVVAELPRAFVYRWRLWSIAELREAMLETGFRAVEIYKDINVAPGQRPVPVEDPAELGEDWIVLVVGRA